MTTRSYFVFLSFLLLGSCAEEPGSPNVIEAIDYFPLQKNNFWIYGVEETRYFPNKTIEEESYQQLDSIVDREIFGESEVFHISSYRRQDSQSEWVYNKNFSVRIYDGNVVYNRGGREILTLVSPVKTGITWDGNLYNTLETDMFEYEFVDKAPLVFNGIELPDGHLSVLQNDNEDYIVNLDIRMEKFGKNVGMLEGYYKNLVFCQQSNCIGQEKIEEGYEIFKVLIEYHIQ